MKLQKLIIYLGMSLFLASCGKKKEAAKQETPAAQAPASADQKADPQAPTAAPSAAVDAAVNSTSANEQAKQKPQTVTQIAKKDANISFSSQAVKANGRNSLKAELQNRKSLAKKSAQLSKSKVLTAAKSTSSKGTYLKKPAAYKVTNSSLQGSSQSGSASNSGIAAKLSSADFLTGGVSEYGLYYSTIANDNVMKTLQEMALEKTSEEQGRDISFAQTVYDAQFLIDRSGDLTVDVTLKDGRKIEERRFVAPFEMGQLAIVNLDSIKMSAECIDLKPRSEDCDNLLVTLEKSGAEAKIIMRQSVARLDYQMDVSEDPEFNSLAQFLRNSNLDYQTSERISTMDVYSFEVLNGKSAQTTVMMGAANQVLSLKSDLTVKKDLSVSLNPVEKAQDWSDLYLEKARFQKDLRFQSMIKSAKLTENNGQGQFAMDVFFESKTSKVQNRIKFKMIRELTPTNF